MAKYNYTAGQTWPAGQSFTPVAYVFKYSIQAIVVHGKTKPLDVAVSFPASLNMTHWTFKQAHVGAQTERTKSSASVQITPQWTTARIETVVWAWLRREGQAVYSVPASRLLADSVYALTGTWKPPTQPRSLWGNSPVAPRAPAPAGGREPRAQASPCPRSEHGGARHQSNDLTHRPNESLRVNSTAAWTPTLRSPSSTSRDDTKLYPWKEGVAKAFLRSASVTKQAVFGSNVG